jgi:hypothetical protein
VAATVNSNDEANLPPALPAKLMNQLTPAQLQQFEASRQRAAEMTQTKVSKGFGPDVDKTG